MAGVLSTSVRDVSFVTGNKSMRNWVNADMIRLLKDNDILFDVFMGLVAQRSTGIQFNFGGGVFIVRTELIRVRPQIVRTKYLIYNLNQAISELDAAISAFNKNKAAVNADFIDKCVDIGKSVTRLSNVLLQAMPTSPTIEAIQEQLNNINDQYLPIVQQTGKVLENIQLKEYSAALFEADALLDNLFRALNTDYRIATTSLKRDIDTAKSIVDDAARKDTLQVRNHNLDSVTAAADKLHKLHDVILHYGLFITTVAAAESSSEVKEAISAFALPKGSSRIKKENNFSWGINGFVGVYHSWNKHYDNIPVPRQETGIFAPLGVAVNWGNIGKDRPGAISLYAGIIDIGAIFTYRVSNDSTEIKSEVRFSQILSPSITAMYSWPLSVKKYNIPLSFGASMQWGPKLKGINNEAGNSVLPLLAQRFHVFAAVDIPIVNFHVRPAKSNDNAHF
jgi:hypothetical protein